ncbi:hypothetical protein MTR67_018361 [Solanum verrucosum]|uniref:Uncharacterized protein n=1 Tax=Solanum verrucosum TaxID=315347 RepID=A0AAF0QKI5_SOLVR|nr:hypothetical protein MTR67_018361 [Solanum verrucosum]
MAPLPGSGEETSVNASNVSQHGHNDDIKDLNNVNVDEIGCADAIRLPPIMSNTIFNVTGTSAAPNERGSNEVVGRAVKRLYYFLGGTNTNDDPNGRVDETCHGGGYKVVDAVGANSGMSPDDAQLEAMYNKEVQFLSNEAGCSCLSYPSPDGNQGWTKDRDSGCRDREGDWHDRGGNWRETDGDRDRYVPPHNYPKPKEPNNDPKTFRPRICLPAS